MRSLFAIPQGNFLYYIGSELYEREGLIISCNYFVRWLYSSPHNDDCMTCVYRIWDSGFYMAVFCIYERTIICEKYKSESALDSNWFDCRAIWISFGCRSEFIIIFSSDWKSKYIIQLIIIVKHAKLVLKNSCVLINSENLDDINCRMKSTAKLVNKSQNATLNYTQIFTMQHSKFSRNNSSNIINFISRYQHASNNFSLSKTEKEREFRLKILAISFVSTKRTPSAQVTLCY